MYFDFIGIYVPCGRLSNGYMDVLNGALDLIFSHTNQYNTNNNANVTTGNEMSLNQFKMNWSFVYEFDTFYEDK